MYKPTSKANVNNIYFLVFANRRLKALAIAVTVDIAKETAHQLMHAEIGANNKINNKRFSKIEYRKIFMCR